LTGDARAGIPFADPWSDGINPANGFFAAIGQEWTRSGGKIGRVQDFAGKWIGDITMPAEEIIQVHPEVCGSFMRVQCRPWNPNLLAATAASLAFK
jgi:hypothetical protein